MWTFSKSLISPEKVLNTVSGRVHVFTCLDNQVRRFLIITTDRFVISSCRCDTNVLSFTIILLFFQMDDDDSSLPPNSIKPVYI